MKNVFRIAAVITALKTDSDIDLYTVESVLRELCIQAKCDDIQCCDCEFNSDKLKHQYKRLRKWSK